MIGPLSYIIRINHECESGIEKSVPRNTVWHYQACRVMKTVSARDKIFFHILTRIMDSFLTKVNSAYPDQMKQNAASDLGLNCLLTDGQSSEKYHPTTLKT